MVKGYLHSNKAIFDDEFSTFYEFWPWSLHYVSKFTQQSEIAPGFAYFYKIFIHISTNWNLEDEISLDSVPLKWVWDPSFGSFLRKKAITIHKKYTYVLVYIRKVFSHINLFDLWVFPFIIKIDRYSADDCKT